MPIFIWLKPGEEKQEHSRKVEVQYGVKFIAVYEDVLDPSINFPNIPNECIDHLTSRESILDKGFRCQGIYRHGGATLMVDTDGNNVQRLCCSAPTYEALREIFRLVRQGQICPDENWEAPQVACPCSHDQSLDWVGETWRRLVAWINEVGRKISTIDLDPAKD